MAKKLLKRKVLKGQDDTVFTPETIVTRDNLGREIIDDQHGNRYFYNDDGSVTTINSEGTEISFDENGNPVYMDVNGNYYQVTPQDREGTGSVPTSVTFETSDVTYPRIRSSEMLRTIDNARALGRDLKVRAYAPEMLVTGKNLSKAQMEDQLARAALPAYLFSPIINKSVPEVYYKINPTSSVMTEDDYNKGVQLQQKTLNTMMGMGASYLAAPFLLPKVLRGASFLGKTFTPSTYTNAILASRYAPAGVTALTGTLLDSAVTGYFGYQGANNLYNAYYHPEEFTSWTDYAQLPLDALMVGAGITGAGRAFKAGQQAMRLSFYNHVTPLGYSTRNYPAGSGRTIPVEQEIKKAIKGFFTEDVPLDPEYIPEWQKRVNVSRYAKGFDRKGHDLAEDAILEFRKQAFRKGLSLPETEVNNIYISNGDGTFRYDYDAIRRINHGRPIRHKVYINSGEPLDVSTTNGARVSLRKLPNGQYEMYDKWDLQPFKETYRAPFGKFGRFISHIPLLRNTEMLTLLGGKPFVLRQTLNPGEILF